MQIGTQIVNTLITWRLVEMIQTEDAPFEVLKRFREYLEDNSRVDYVIPHYETGKFTDVKNDTLKGRILAEINEAVQCHWCLSIWVGCFVAVATGENILCGFAYSAGSLLINHFHNEKWETWVQQLANSKLREFEHG